MVRLHYDNTKARQIESPDGLLGILKLVFGGVQLL